MKGRDLLPEEEDQFNEADSLKISSMRREGMRRKHQLLKNITPFSRNKDYSLEDSLLNKSFAHPLHQEEPADPALLKRQVEQLRRELALAHEEIRRLTHNFTGGNVSAGEVQRLADDNARLLSLLRKTKEYKEFVIGQEGQQLSFLRTLLKNRKKCCACNQSVLERQLWAPRSVYDLLDAFAKDQRLELDRAGVEALVSRLDAFYRSGEQARTKRLCRRQERELEEARRQANEACSYEMMQVRRLQQREQSRSRR